MIAALFQNPRATRIKRTAKFMMSVVVIAKQTRLTRNTPPPTRRLKSIGSPLARTAKPSGTSFAVAALGMGPIATSPWDGGKPIRPGGFGFKRVSPTHRLGREELVILAASARQVP